MAEEPRYCCKAHAAKNGPPCPAFHHDVPQWQRPPDPVERDPNEHPGAS